MTLALLLTAVTGAWAQSYEAKVFDVPASWTEDNTYLSAADMPKDFVQITKDEAMALAVPDGPVVLIYGFVGENVLMMVFDNGTAIPDDDDDGNPEARGQFIVFQTIVKAKVCYTAEAGPAVAWNASTKTGTFAMPGSDVVLTPIYANAAAFATTGTGSEVTTLLPEAAEGVIAGTDASLIAEGTGIVANIGETTTAQGTLMYAIGTSATEAPALTAFSATAPTAKNIADDGATVYVWYYIQGADAPQGEAATLDNTFNDTEPACLTVQVLTNKFDITFNAANANTIEAGKATVTVDGTDKTSAVTEGKLQGVKMGSEVKLKAATGYKFRKVEAKKNDGSTRLDESTVGMIVCTNGKAYPVAMKDNLPSGVTAVGIVAYKNGKNGLVMALTDEATNMNWDTATGNNGAKAHTPVVEGYTWKVPTIYEWQYNIFSGSGVSNLAGLSTYMTAAGGTGLQNGCYWTSTPKNNSYYARCINIENGSINFSPGGNTELKSNGYHVRAVFAF